MSIFVNIFKEKYENRHILASIGDYKWPDFFWRKMTRFLFVCFIC